MELSVIVPSLHPPGSIEVTPYLERCPFEDYELIVCDDEPVSRARNEGIDRASADKLVFLDDDSRPQPGYLSGVAEILEEESVVTGKTVHPPDDIFAEHFTGHYAFGDEPRYVDQFWGCNVAMRRSVAEAVGGWNEAMGWGHEDKEFADRVREEAPIYYDPDLVVYHCYAESLLDFWRKQYELELQTPYYWSLQGLSEREMLATTLGVACNPINYLGYTPTHLAARAGETLSKTAGRLVGLLASGRDGGSASQGQPEPLLSPPHDAVPDSTDD